METKQVLKHTCFQKDSPLSPVKCQCRKYVSVADAAALIANGSAQLIIKRYQDVSVQEPCPVCAGDETLLRSCTACLRSGTVTVSRQIPVYGEDIITTVQEKGKRLVNTTAKKTPRSPTIESKHILRAIGATGSGADAAHERWDEYELLTLKERIRLLTPDVNTVTFNILWNVWILDTDKPFPVELRREPEDDPKLTTGRRYDYGRSI